MTIHRIPIYDRPAVHAGGNQKAEDLSELGKATDLSEPRADLPRRLDHSNRSEPTSPSTRPQSELSTLEHEKATSAAELVAARILAVLLVALAVTSIVALKVFSDDGNASAALVAGALGMSSAALGMIFGFMKAYQSS
jgi:hypothetical protein